MQRGMPRQNLESAYRLGTSFFAALLAPRAQKNGQVATDVCVWRHCVDVGGRQWALVHLHCEYWGRGVACFDSKEPLGPLEKVLRFRFSDGRP